MGVLFCLLKIIYSNIWIMMYNGSIDGRLKSTCSKGLAMEYTYSEIGHALKEDLKELAKLSYQLQLEKMPELKAMTSKEFIDKSIRDTEFTILYLSNAISVSSKKLFLNYVEWFVELMENIKIPIKYLAGSIECIYEVIEWRYDKAFVRKVKPYMDDALSFIEKSTLDKSLPDKSEHILATYREIYVKYLLGGERLKANELIQSLLSFGYSVQDIYMEIFHESQHEIGRLWQSNKISIAEEHYCTAATQLIMGQLYPLIFATPKTDRVFVGTCVGGELHELGVRMVSDFMELEGWNTYYLGANTPVKSIIETVIKEKADVLGISVTMTFHVDEARMLIEAIRGDVRCSDVKIMVGGYPFIVDDRLWKTLGADGFAKDARNAVKVAAKLAGKEKSDGR